MTGRPHVLLVILLTACADPVDPGPAIGELPPVQSCLAGQETFPERLSDTGCFEDVSALIPASSVIPYGVRSPLWTDGADKPRFFALPAGTTIGYREDGPLDLPDGTVLLKAFALGGVVGDPDGERLMEVRLMRSSRGDWEFATYRVDEALGDGARLDGQLIEEVETNAGTVRYLFPSNDACMTCHGRAAGVVLGPRVEQLNRRFDYGHVVADQLTAIAEAGLFGPDVVVDPAHAPALPDPADPSVPIEQRARSWLHGNCAHCHRPGGWTSPDIDMDLRYELPLSQTGTCDEPRRYFGADVGNYRIRPGDPADSAILGRILADGVSRMPPLGVSIPDPLGVALLTEWIEALPECPP